MTDFAMANSNPDAMWLASLYRAYGITPRGNGIAINATQPTGYRLALPLFSLEVTPAGVQGTYHPSVDGVVQMSVEAPTTPHTKCVPKCESVAVGKGAELVLRLRAGESAPFAVQF